MNFVNNKTSIYKILKYAGPALAIYLILRFIPGMEMSNTNAVITTALIILVYVLFENLLYDPQNSDNCALNGEHMGSISADVTRGIDTIRSSADSLYGRLNDLSTGATQQVANTVVAGKTLSDNATQQIANTVVGTNNNMRLAPTPTNTAPTNNISEQVSGASANNNMITGWNTRSFGPEATSVTPNVINTGMSETANSYNSENSNCCTNIQQQINKLSAVHTQDANQIAQLRQMIENLTNQKQQQHVMPTNQGYSFPVLMAYNECAMSPIIAGTASDPNIWSH